jgi:transcriptional regulator with XRE-family HTH domain
MGLSLRNAAKEAGVSKSTILRAVQGGRLSATRTADGGYDIDPAELFRVYQPQQAERPSTDAKGQDAPAPAPVATAALEAQLEGLREILRRADAVADELRQDRDKWRQMAEHQQRLIEDQRPRSWWKRLTG